MVGLCLTLCSVLLIATQTACKTWTVPLDLFSPLLSSTSQDCFPTPSIPPALLHNDVNHRRPAFFHHTSTKWETREFWRLSGFPLHLRSLAIRVLVPTKASECGGGWYPVREIQEFSVWALSTVKTQWGERPVHWSHCKPASHPHVVLGLADTDTLSWLEGQELCPKSSLY